MKSTTRVQLPTPSAETLTNRGAAAKQNPQFSSTNGLPRKLKVQSSKPHHQRGFLRQDCDTTTGSPAHTRKRKLSALIASAARTGRQSVVTIWNNTPLRDTRAQSGGAFNCQGSLLPSPHNTKVICAIVETIFFVLLRTSRSTRRQDGMLVSSNMGLAGLEIAIRL